MFQDLLDGIKSLLSSLAENIVIPIKEFLVRLFVPELEEFRDKIDKIKGYFSFVSGIKESGELLFSVLTEVDPEPPVLYVDLSAAESEYNWGEKVPILDLSWYERYKPTVDVIVSAILWAFFIWRVYIRLPSLISGGSATVDHWGGVSGSRSAGNISLPSSGDQSLRITDKHGK